jgi:hypothetical protein
MSKAYEGGIRAMSTGQKVGGPIAYQIKVQGRIDEQRWSGWFTGLTITVECAFPPITALTGAVDQAALRGILNRLWDLNLTLISVVPTDAAGNERCIPGDKIKGR